jgi:hypothetical protein
MSSKSDQAAGVGYRGVAPGALGRHGVGEVALNGQRFVAVGQDEVVVPTTWMMVLPPTVSRAPSPKKRLTQASLPHGADAPPSARVPGATW